MTGRVAGKPGRTGDGPGSDRPSIWLGVEALIDRAPTLADLRAHGLQLLAAGRWRASGWPLPEELVLEERRAALVMLAASEVLARARAAYDGAMLLMKGMEVAARYPDSALRPMRDLDLLVDDAPRAQQALVRAGFQPVGEDDRYYDDRHHLRPLLWPGLPVLVEVHRRPEWVRWGSPPSTEEVLADAIPASAGVTGVLAPDPAQHALLLAAHSWSDVPLRRILDLVDVSLLAQESSRAEIVRIASRWGIEGMWTTTITAADALFFGAPRPLVLRSWARNLQEARDATVLENHIRRLVSPFSVLSPGQAARASLAALARELRPCPGESWRAKLARTRHALLNALERRSEHDDGLDRRRLLHVIGPRGSAAGGFEADT